MKTGRKQFELFGCLGRFLQRSRGVSFLMILLVFAVCVFMLKWMPKNDLPPLNPGDPVQEDVLSRITFRTNIIELVRKTREAELNSALHYNVDDPDKERENAILNSFDLMMKETLRRRDAETGGEKYDASECPDPKVAEFVEKMDSYLCSVLAEKAENDKSMSDALENVRAVIGGGIIAESKKNEIPLGKSIVVHDRENRILEKYEYSAVPTPEKSAQFTAESILPDSLASAGGRSAGKELQIAREDLKGFFETLYADGNLTFNREKTEECKAEEIERETKTIKEKTYQEGAVLISRKDAATEEDFELYKVYRKAYNDELLKQRTWFSPFQLQKTLLVVLLIVFCCIFMLRVHPDLLGNNRTIWLIGLVVVLSLLVNYSVIVLCNKWMLDGRLKAIFPLYLAMPLALPALVIAPIYSGKAAIFSGMFVAGVSAVALDLSFPAFAVGLFVCAVGTASTRYVYDYKKFIVRGFMSCFITMLVSALVFQQDPDFLTMAREHRIKQLLGFLFVPVATGMLTAMLAAGAVIALETLLDVTCNMTYLSLTDRNHPLLKKLQLEAPGTYHHCERVALLAEDAANSVGAMSLKVQAYALFHDVGKLASPELFTENAGGKDMFAGKPPAESAAAIRNHVEYGVQLAKKYNLKTPFRRAIECHHGNDFISFFYEKEKERTGKIPPEEPFRYPGPLPEEVETVILMLADCCEAAVCSLTDPTEENVRAMVEKIFSGKIQRHQLDAADITVAQLSKIRESFLKTFKSMNHSRISYSRGGEGKKK